MKLTDLVIDWEKSLGENLMAVDIQESYLWTTDGKRSNKADGWNVEVVCPALKFDKQKIKVIGSRTQPFEIVNNEPITVKFIGLNGKAYNDYKTGQIKFAITAEDVTVLEE